MGKKEKKRLSAIAKSPTLDTDKDGVSNFVPKNHNSKRHLFQKYTYLNIILCYPRIDRLRLDVYIIFFIPS